MSKMMKMSQGLNMGGNWYFNILIGISVNINIQQMLLSSNENNHRALSGASENYNSSNRKNLKGEKFLVPLTENKNRNFNRLNNINVVKQSGEARYCENHSSTTAKYISRTHGDEE